VDDRRLQGAGKGGARYVGILQDRIRVEVKSHQRKRENGLADDLRDPEANGPGEKI